MLDYDQERVVLKNRIRRRGIYILPNLFTLAALFAGFYAIVQAMNLNFDQAAIAIFVAMVLDSLDGRVARLTKTQSAFGAEFDSLADMVSFGAAPALVMYEWVLRDLGKLGLGRARSSTAPARRCASRASTRCSTSPTSAGSPASRARPPRRSSPGFVWIVDDYDIDPAVDPLVGAVRHGVRRPHDGEQPQVLQLQDDQPAQERAVRGRAAGGRRGRAAALQPPLVLFAGFVAYALSGYVVSAWLRSAGVAPAVRIECGRARGAADRGARSLLQRSADRREGHRGLPRRASRRASSTSTTTARPTAPATSRAPPARSSAAKSARARAASCGGCSPRSTPTSTS